jgi:hypothetical protein
MIQILQWCLSHNFIHSQHARLYVDRGMCMWYRKNWVTFFYLHPFCGLCGRWLCASTATRDLGFPEFLKELSHFCQFLLQFIPVVRGMIKIFCEAVLDHPGNHLSIILRDCVVPVVVIVPSFSCVHTCILYHWSLSPPGSCVMGFDAVSCAPSASFLCPLVGWVVSVLPSGSLAALSRHLPESTWVGPFFISWVLGFVEAVSLPAQPLLLLFVPVLLWV